MKQGMSEEMLRTLGRITEVPDFDKVIVSEVEGRPVTDGDVASVEDIESVHSALSGDVVAGSLIEGSIIDDVSVTTP